MRGVEGCERPKGLRSLQIRGDLDFPEKTGPGIDERFKKSACGKVEQVWLIGKSNLSRSCASRQSAEGKKFPNGLPSFPLAHTLSVRVKNSCRRPPPPPASNLNLRL